MTLPKRRSNHRAALRHCISHFRLHPFSPICTYTWQHVPGSAALDACDRKLISFVLFSKRFFIVDLAKAEPKHSVVSATPMPRSTSSAASTLSSPLMSLGSLPKSTLPFSRASPYGLEVSNAGDAASSAADAARALTLCPPAFQAHPRTRNQTQQSCGWPQAAPAMLDMMKPWLAGMMPACAYASRLRSAKRRAPAQARIHQGQQAVKRRN